MISREQLDEFIEHYGQIAVHTFTVPVDRDKLKEVVLTLDAALLVVEAAELQEYKSPNLQMALAKLKGVRG